MKCPLCFNSQSQPIDRASQFLSCNACSIFFRDTAYFLSSEKERQRYLLHNNDPSDPRYQQFVMPIVEAICKEVTKGSTGLDFGAGTGPVIAQLLEDDGYRMVLWDPFFHPDKKVLDGMYDFIVCCEVIEHFHEPMNEFKLMLKMLKPGGSIYCMTELVPHPSQFEFWYYKDDPTHVVFYSEKSLHWIKETLGFSELIVNNRLITLRTNNDQ